ncbi:MAG: sulfatase [FCB group bacterium]|jgi:arylsulfatase A-like enzyme|nr:sulfatase [FCB group bacterium]
MDRRAFLGLAGAGLLAGALGCVTRGIASGRKPNIVLVLTDDFGYADLGCYGSPLNETPRIDALASEGVRFSDAYAACPVCSPTRASIMTGKYPARLHLTNFLKGVRSPEDSPVLTAPYKDQLDLEEITVAEYLREAGYVTGHVGKWHLGAEPHFPEHQGFDETVGTKGAGGPGSYFWPGWKKNLDLEGRFEGEYLTDRLSEEASKFIERHADRPFFLNVCHYAPHIKQEAKPDLVEKYRKKLESHPAAPGAQNNPVNAAMVESIDQGVGAILDTLERLKLTDNTVFIFTSDNGGLSVLEGKNPPSTFNTPLREGKGHLYEGGIRVPLIVRWPGVTPRGAACAAPVCSIDYLPTLCAAAGVTPKQSVDGIDVSALFAKPERTLEREAIYWHYPHFANQGGRPGGAVRCGDWKLIESYETGKIELYNLKDDIGETRDLATSQPETAKRLHKMLSDWRKEVDATMPPPNPAWKGN